MAQVSLTTDNGLSIQLDGDLASITTIMTALGYNAPAAASSPVAPAVDPVQAKAQTFYAFLNELLPQYVPGGQLFVATLERIRANGEDYQGLQGAYYQLTNRKVEGWPERRKALLVTSAIWRYTFGHWTDDQRSSLRSQIEADLACPDGCGKLANQIVDRLKAQGLWV